MPIIPLICPMCSGNIKVDSDQDAAICEYCGRPFIVKDAIVNNYIQNVININAENVNIYTQKEKEFAITAGTLKKYEGEAVDVEIPSGVHSISEEAFMNLSVHSIKIPDGVKDIGDRAFYGCQDLKSVYLPNTITEIGSEAFCGCSNLESADLPEKITVIKNGLFRDCESLKSAKMPFGVKKIEEYAFKGCKSLLQIEFPESLNLIENYAFYECVNLRNVITNKSFYSSEVVLKLGNNLDKSQDWIWIGTNTFWRSPQNWKQNNLCQYCGGNFKGFKSKVCSKCGKPKDYDL